MVETGHNLTIEELASRKIGEKDAIITRLQLDISDLRTRLDAARRDRDHAEKTLRLVRTVMEDSD